LILAQN